MLFSNKTRTAGADWVTDLYVEPQCNYLVAQITVPESKAVSGTEVQIQGMRIANMGELDKYTWMAPLDGEYNVFLQESGALHKSRLLSVTVTYDKNVSLEGGFVFHKARSTASKGFNVIWFQPISPPLPDGSNVQVTVSISNPSSSTYETGSINVNMSVADVPAATCPIQDVLLQPGDNVFPMIATVNQATIKEPVLGPYKSGIIPADVVAT
ncbi:uncharacterized protein Z520_09357 [Fonsecaea multimorphosa CBS 102226]|uniref:Uncharacterized protein n=1 Tax=Fonsecaea multimorphosa CBS 102226 TaxID=1442371 RepID=A0A0D2JNZ0_9EURO|nr:uncharacterized protein Z520_09357 [Fonsecaea multimorphosa CBS 102226]KIX95047.1 hypothetical protein Z520_09357 [Fonsecaea multimorphosa CBS 102226]